MAEEREMGGEEKRGPSDGPGDEKGAVDIDVEDATPGADVVFDREFRLRDPGEAEQDVDAAEDVRHPRDGRIDGAFIRDVDLLEPNPRPRSFAADAGQVFHRPAAHPRVDVEDRQLLDAVLEERSRADEAETLGPAGHWGGRRLSLAGVGGGWGHAPIAFLPAREKRAAARSAGVFSGWTREGMG